ncbi:hypothetical protein ACFL35_01165 [Candidatus Riflebacteria bacterium]
MKFFSNLFFFLLVFGQLVLFNMSVCAKSSTGPLIELLAIPTYKTLNEKIEAAKKEARAGIEVRFYAQKNYKGNYFSLSIWEKIEDLTKKSYPGGGTWDNKIASIKIIKGKAKICVSLDKEFGGDGRQYISSVSELKSTRLGKNIDRQISSIRVVPPDVDVPVAPPVLEYKYELAFLKNPLFTGNNNTEVRFYEHVNYRGSYLSLRVGEKIDDLKKKEVRKGVTWNDQISSIKFLGYAGVECFNDRNFKGAKFTNSRNVPNMLENPKGLFHWLHKMTWNDKISSLRVSGGVGTLLVRIWRVNPPKGWVSLGDYAQPDHLPVHSQALIVRDDPKYLKKPKSYKKKNKLEKNLIVFR